MTDRGAVATARAVGERLADDIRHADLADILRLPELELPDRRAAIHETREALQGLPDRDVAVLAEALRELPRRVAGMEPIRVPRDAPIPDRLVEAMPFLERERRTSPIVLTIAVVSIVGLVMLGLAMTFRRVVRETQPELDDELGMASSDAALAPGGGTTSLAASGTATDAAGTGPWAPGTHPSEEGI